MGDGRDLRPSDDGNTSGSRGYSDISPSLGDEVWNAGNRGQPTHAGDPSDGGSTVTSPTTGAPSGSGQFDGGPGNSQPGGSIRQYRAPYGQVAPDARQAVSDGQRQMENTDPNRVDVRNFGRAGYNQVSPGARAASGTSGESGGSAPEAPGSAGGGGDGQTPQHTPDEVTLPSSLEKALTLNNRHVGYLPFPSHILIFPNPVSGLTSTFVGGAAGFISGGPFAYGASYMAKAYLARSSQLLGWLEAKREMEGGPLLTGLDRDKYQWVSRLEKPLKVGQKLAQGWEDTFGVSTSNMVLAAIRRRDNANAKILDKTAKKLWEEGEVRNGVVISAKTCADKLNNLYPGMAETDKDLVELYEYVRGGATGEIPRSADAVLARLGMEAPARNQVMRNLGELRNARGALNPFFGTGVDFTGYAKYLDEVENPIVARLKAEAQKIPASGATTEQEKAVLDWLKYFDDPLAVKMPASSAAGIQPDEIAEIINKNDGFLGELSGIMKAQGVSAGELKARLANFLAAHDRVGKVKELLQPEAYRVLKLHNQLNPDEQWIFDRWQLLKSGFIKPGEALTTPGLVSKTEETLLRERGRAMIAVKDLEEGIGLPRRGIGLKNFMGGMAAVSFAQGIDDRIDRFLGPLHFGSGVYLDTLAVPLVWTADQLSLKGKVGWSIAAYAACKFIDAGLDSIFHVSENPSWGAFQRPTNLEAVAVGGVAMLPWKTENPWVRIGWTAAAWAGSKAVNAVLEGPSAKELRDTAVDSLHADASERTADSMDSAIDKYRDLGKGSRPGEATLEYYLDDWVKKTDHRQNPVEGRRGAAILYAASGEMRLDQGSWVGMDPLTGMGLGTRNSSLLENIGSWFTSYKDKAYDSILPGYDLDLGGQATRDLIRARAEIEEAKKWTQTEIDSGSNIGGSKPSADEIAQLDQVDKRLDDDLSRVWAKHDIPGAYSQLVGYTHSLLQGSGANIRSEVTSNLARFIILHRKNPKDPNETIDIQSLSDTERQYLSKLYRDLAMVNLACAGYMVDHIGEGSRKWFGFTDGLSALPLYRQARAALQQAQRLTPDNPDLPDLLSIADQVGSEDLAAVDRQWSSPSTNGLNVNNRTGH